MSITTLSSQELDKDIDRAKKASQKGPVLITEHSEATLVLLSIEEYKRLTRPHRTIADSLSMPEAIKQYIDDLEVLYLAEQALLNVRAGKDDTIPLETLIKIEGL